MLSQHIQNLPITHLPVKLRNRLQHLPHKQPLSLHIPTLSKPPHNRNRIFLQISPTIHIEIMHDINIVNNNDNKNTYI